MLLYLAYFCKYNFMYLPKILVNLLWRVNFQFCCVANPTHYNLQEIPTKVNIQVCFVLKKGLEILQKVPLPASNLGAEQDSVLAINN